MSDQNHYIGNNGHLTIQTARAGILAGFLIYGLFGIIDPFMIPEHYKIVWGIRFGIVTPAIALVYALSFTKSFKNYAKPLLMALLFIGELGILAMIYISQPHQAAFLAYYAGLNLVILWAGFIFKLSFSESLFYFISIFVMYNLIAISKQNIFTYDKNSLEYSWYIGNNFFLVANGLLALIGTNHLNKSTNELIHKNQQLLKDQKTLESAKDKAQESDKLKTAFLTNMSHEVRTPMNGIIGFSELYLDKDSTDEEKKYYANVVIESSKQLLRIVNDILDLSKIETNQIIVDNHFKDLCIGFKNTYQLFEKQCREKNIEFVVSIPKIDFCNVKTDHIRLFQIINNLLENAIKFTHEGEIEFGFKIIDNQKLRVFVRDTGIGIPKDYQDLIFERFRQIETSQTKMYRGTGLGLSISKQLVKLLGGTIDLNSHENKGSEFTITIPCEVKMSQTESQEEKNIDRLKLKSRKHLLIAEDEENNFVLLKIYLKNCDLHIANVKDGEEAIEYVKHHNDIDLILMDVKMPKVNGIKAMQEIKKETTDIPIIAQTAFVMAEDKKKLIDFGFDDYIPKPIEKRDLFTLLDKYLVD